ncbi:periplasmic heavy metal sensor [candidate division FCPU426 bacterium]|nr:periplasmic heavy metal sensor [candidate division FCPU426 bacterium]
MKKAVGVLTISLFLLAAGASWALLDTEEQAKINALAETLKLDDGQKAKLALEREASKKELLRLEKKWQSLHDQLRREIRKEKPDPEQTKRLTAEIGKVRGEILDLRTNSLIYLKSILKAEQKSILEEGRPADAGAAPEKQGGKP